MFLFGKNESDRIYIGGKHVLRIYKGLVLWYKYSREIAVKAISKLFSKATATLEMAIAGAMSAIGKVSSGADAKIALDAVVKPKAEGKATLITDVKGGVGYTAKIKADNMSFSAADAELTDHSGNIQAEEQHIIAKDIAKVEAGTARPQETENHILFTQKIPTANKGQVLSQPVEQDMKMFITDTVSAGAGHAKAQKAETHGFFSYVKPKMLAQKIMPEMQEVKAFFKDIVSFGSGHARPQQATDNKIYFTAEKSTLEFGNALPKSEEQKMHIGNTVSGGVGHAKGSTAEAKHIVKDFAQIAGETKDVTAETGAYSDNVVKFDKTYGNGIKAENGGISGGTGVVYKPKKQLEIDNAGGISGADSKIYKPDKLFKTDTLVKSGNFARLFRIVCMSAQTTAKLITQPPLFKYVFLGTASGSGVSSGTGILDIATPAEFNQWHYQQGNTLYIFTASTAEQSDSEITIDAESVNVWHEQKENVLYINTVNTAQQTDTQVEIDTAITEEWTVQAENTLYINRAIGTLQTDTDVEIDIIENLKWAKQNGNVLTINQILTDEDIGVI